MRRGKTKVKIKSVSDTVERSNIFGSNIQSIKGSDLNYFNVFLLAFYHEFTNSIENSQAT